MHKDLKLDTADSARFFLSLRSSLCLFDVLACLRNGCLLLCDEVNSRRHCLADRCRRGAAVVARIRGMCRLRDWRKRLLRVRLMMGRGIAMVWRGILWSLVCIHLSGLVALRPLGVPLCTL